MGYERRHNSVLKLATDADAFVEAILAGQTAPPLYFARMKKLNRDGVPLLDTLPRPAEYGPAELSAIDTAKTAVLDLRPWEAYRLGAHRRVVAPSTRRVLHGRRRFVREAR